MSLGIAVLLVIIVVDIIALVAVMYVGSREDKHHGLHDVDSFESISQLRERGYKITPSGKIEKIEES